MAKKMYKLIVTQSVTVVRDGKRVTPPINKVYEFTEAEAAMILKANPQGLRRPVNETAPVVDSAQPVSDDDDVESFEEMEDIEDDDAVEDETPAPKAKPSRRRSAKKTEDDDI